MRVALLLRDTGHVTAPQGRFGHSPFTDMLRMRVLEYDMIRPMVMARMTSMAALYGNSRADVEKGSESVQKNYETVMAYLPYLQAEVGTSTSSIDEERAQAIERFRKWRDASKTQEQ